MLDTQIMILREYENIGFDLDGTLLSQATYDSCVFSLFLQRDRSLSEAMMIGQKIAEYKRVQGYGAPHVLDNFVAEHPQMSFNVVKMLEFYREGHVVDMHGGCQLEETLSDLANLRKNLFLVTNGRRKVQVAKINSLGIAHYFDSIIILDPVEKSPLKPSAESMSMYRLREGRTIYLGDQELDRKYAENCKYDFRRIML